MGKGKELHSFCNILVPNKEKIRECCGNSILFTKVSLRLTSEVKHSRLFANIASLCSMFTSRDLVPLLFSLIMLRQFLK